MHSRDRNSCFCCSLSSQTACAPHKRSCCGASPDLSSVVLHPPPPPSTPLLTAVLIHARREKHRDNNSHLKWVRYMFPTVSFFHSCLEILQMNPCATDRRQEPSCGGTMQQRASVWARGATCFRYHQLQPLPLKLLLSKSVSPPNETVAAAETQVPHRTAVVLGAIFWGGGGLTQSSFHCKHQILIN